MDWNPKAKKSPRHLDIGHTMYGEELLAERGSSIGVDPEISSSVLAQDREFLNVRGIAEHLPFKSNSLRRVTSAQTIGSDTNLEESLTEVVRVLRPGGTASIRMYDDYDPQDLRDLLRDLPVTRVFIRQDDEVTIRLGFTKV